MAQLKSYTDLEQSKKLAEILPLESADWTILNCYNEFGQKDGSNIRVVKEVHTLNEFVEKIPCWSLAALLGVLPKIIKSETLFIEVSAALWHIGYRNIYTARDSNPVDACYEMIMKLHELNLL